MAALPAAQALTSQAAVGARGLDANKVACKDSSSRLDVSTWQVGCDRLVGGPLSRLRGLSLSRATQPCVMQPLDKPGPASRLGQAVIAGQTSADVCGDPR